jgi:hypothetical protein
MLEMLIGDKGIKTGNITSKTNFEYEGSSNA